MTVKEFENYTDMEKLRVIVKALDNCNETFLDRYSMAELIKIYRAWLACGWDIWPDQWEDRQVKDALRGIVPNWDRNEKPIYLRPATR